MNPAMVDLMRSAVNSLHFVFGANIYGGVMVRGLASLQFTPMLVDEALQSPAVRRNAEATRRLKGIRAEAQRSSPLAEEEAKAGWPQINAQVLIAIWSAFEAAMDDATFALVRLADPLPSCVGTIDSE